MNYYNEIDNYAAEWIENLIGAGHIPAGVVDRRSIEDVAPSDLAGFTQCHFFAGIAGWSLALRIAGVPDDYPIWTGSCPCQPFSAAGKGAGFDDQRHLWPAFFHLIRECKPTAVFGEQVASKAADPWIDLVHADLEGVGYAFGCVPFPAAGVGAPHIRDRNYWVGYAHDPRLEGLRGRLEAAHRYGQGAFRPVATAGEFGRLEHTCGVGGEGGVHRGCCNSTPPFRASDVYEHPSTVNGMADTFGIRCDEQWEAPPFAVQGQCTERSGEHSQSRQPRLVSRGFEGLGSTGRPGPTNGFWSAADWLSCRDGKWRPVEPGTFPLAHGVPSRVGRLRAYGNAISPWQAAEFLMAALP